MLLLYFAPLGGGRNLRFSMCLVLMGLMRGISAAVLAARDCIFRRDSLSREDNQSCSAGRGSLYVRGPDG